MIINCKIRLRKNNVLCSLSYKIEGIAATETINVKAAEMKQDKTVETNGANQRRFLFIQSITPTEKIGMMQKTDMFHQFIFKPLFVTIKLTIFIQ